MLPFRAPWGPGQPAPPPGLAPKGPPVTWSGQGKPQSIFGIHHNGSDGQMRGPQKLDFTVTCLAKSKYICVKEMCFCCGGHGIIIYLFIFT